MKILGIETSCDETSAAVIVGDKSIVKILSNVVSSQIDIHRKYGGVVPGVASRAHVEVIIPVIKEALEKASKKLKDIEALAVTSNPGLIGSLSVGLSSAKALSFVLNKKCFFFGYFDLELIDTSATTKALLARYKTHETSFCPGTYIGCELWGSHPMKWSKCISFRQVFRDTCAGWGDRNTQSCAQ